ncbi:FkbM family methyltransferase [Azospirillum rugosum]|uniref:FkbM family methyltransferase n=1 Tax=Azospirillum rugosum TaxID=416170 RepID=A0ABS4SNN1_9PROT|nr:FkbM family methyltransferase [Azospirillum rugosum]MBP2293693.1 FkbM family methyltransferase [Azospirillum rugosum]MDQ0527238.1 FkbM family methyltransferase [Azospirillum rugosum]
MTAASPSRPAFFRRLRRLLAHPGFRAEPVAVLARAALWAGCVAMKQSPRFSLTAGGERLRVPPDLRYTSVTAFVLRDWSEPELRELQQFVRPGAVFIDAGANIGLYTLKAARLAGPEGTVVAVEPGRTAADRLAANVALNRFAKVHLVRKALSDRNGTAVLHHVVAGGDLQAFSLLGDSATREGEEVATVTLDSLVEELKLPRIDCIKMDVEGAEPMVVEGARRSLERWHPTILFEVNSAILHRRGERTDACWDRLEELGYRFWRLQDGRLVPIDRVPDDFCNVVAMHEAAGTDAERAAAETAV